MKTGARFLTPRFLTLAAAAMLLAGCGSSARSMLERDDSGVQASAYPDLTMPPDLRLPAPGTAPAPATQQVATNNAQATAPAAPAPSANRPQYGDDVYAQAGISIYKPDGSRKSDQELRDELRQYYLAKKRQKNANYGSVFNIGNIFRDE